MHERIKALRGLEPRHAGKASYQAILETAAGLFDQFSPLDLALRDIITASGVGNQTVYNYFPEGRDDIALVLRDRYLLAVQRDFRALIGSMGWPEAASPEEVTRLLCGCLTLAIFTPLKEQFSFHVSLQEYLRAHGLLAIANHTDSLAESFHQELAHRHGNAIASRDQARIAHLCVHVSLELAQLGLHCPDYPMDGLEANARLLSRTLLHSVMKDQHPASVGIALMAETPTGMPIAPISPQKRQSIFERITRRKSPR